MAITHRFSLSVVILFAVLRVPSVDAQITWGGCTDALGRPVLSVRDPTIPDVAMAGLTPTGAPIIRYNPIILAWVSDPTRLFFYGHECGHHALGHVLGTTHPLLVEQQADCWGARSLREAGKLSDDDISAIQRDLSVASSGDWTHLPGPVRAVNLRRCLGGSVDSDKIGRCMKEMPEKCLDTCQDFYERPYHQCLGLCDPRSALNQSSWRKKCQAKAKADDDEE